MWLDIPGELRSTLFSLEAAARREEQIRLVRPDEELWAPLAVLAELTADPVRADPARLVHACRRISVWADAHDASGTRLSFVQTAARLRPRDAVLAVEVGRLARELGQHARSESWFRHAIRIARGTDWASYAWAYVGLGVLYIRTGNRPGAEALLGRALRTARRRRLGPVAGTAHHHLFHLTTEAGRLREGYEHARAALEAYGADHTQIPALVHDVGRYWLHLGEHSRAIPLFESVLGVVPSANDRALAAGNLARALAGAGLRERYEAARTIAVENAGRAHGTYRLAHAYEAVAHADLSVGEWERAERSARVALELASATGDVEVQLTAEAQVAAARSAKAEPVGRPLVEPPAAVRQARLLANDLVRVIVPGALSLSLG
jgi:tetratricopeptide (TPR) repeat protein